jgi:hypothetical protein
VSYCPLVHSSWVLPDCVLLSYPSRVLPSRKSLPFGVLSTSVLPSWGSAHLCSNSREFFPSVSCPPVPCPPESYSLVSCPSVFSRPVSCPPESFPLMSCPSVSGPPENCPLASCPPVSCPPEYLCSAISKPSFVCLHTYVLLCPAHMRPALLIPPISFPAHLCPSPLDGAHLCPALLYLGLLNVSYINLPLPS